MPFPVGAAIAGGASLLGTGFTAASQGKMNRKTREWNEWQYEKQRINNFKDWQMQNQYNEGLWNKQNEYNEKLWHMQNEYNSPMAQMARFKEAGLNPNLIYGQSNTGGSIATANPDTSTLSSDRVGGWNPQAPKFDLQDGIMSYAAFREKAAQTNNLEAQNELIKNQALNVLADTRKKTADTKGSDLANRLTDSLYLYQVDAMKLANTRKSQEIELAVNQEERNVANNKADLLQKIENLKNTKAVRQNIQVDIQLKMLEHSLKKNEVSPRHAAKILSEHLDALFDRVK